MYYSAVQTLIFTFILTSIITLATACGLVAETPQPDGACFPACAVDQTCTLSEDRMTTRCIDTFTGGGPLEGIESCQWLAECVDECERQNQDSECAAECELQAAEDVLKVHSTWRACVHTNCNAIRSAECLREWCAPQTTRCFGDLPGDALTIGRWSCPEVAECTQSCQDDTDCPEECLHHGTSDAQTHWTNLTTCAAPHCPDPTSTLSPDTDDINTNTYLECTQTHCPDPHKACFGPGPNPPEGTLSCAELHRCSLDCADYICLENCHADATLQARYDYESLVDCTLGRCSPHNKKEYDAALCIPMMCGHAMHRCFNELPLE